MRASLRFGRAELLRVLPWVVRNVEQRYSLGFDDKRETHYLSIRVGNALVDYEVFYAIEKAEFAVHSRRIRNDAASAT